MHICRVCHHTLRTVAQARLCIRSECPLRQHEETRRRVEEHEDDNAVLDIVLGAAILSGLSRPPAETEETFKGGDGESSGGGASGSFDAPDAPDAPSAPDTSSSSDSSSSSGGDQ